MTRLITAGCSFSQYNPGRGQKYDDDFGVPYIAHDISPWVNHLEPYFDKSLHLGLSSVGNGIISRRVISYVDKLLSQGEDDIVVGIMWSGYARGEIYYPDITEDKKRKIETKYATKNGVIDHFTWISDHETDDKWLIVNPWWYGPENDSYYRTFDMAHLSQTTLENVLRTQWFLEKHNVKYFMMNFRTDWIGYDGDLPFADLQKTYDMIDTNNWVTKQGCYDWCLENTNIPFIEGDDHPSTEQHNLFTKRVILPFIKEKGYV